MNSIDLDVALVHVKDVNYYFKEFMGQKSVYLNEGEINNYATFRSTFLIRSNFSSPRIDKKPNDLSLYCFLERVQAWKTVKTVWNYLCGNSFSGSLVVDYIFEYDLPENWEHGVDLNFLDQFIIFARKLFLTNVPESCEDEEKFSKFLIHMMKKVELVEESIQKTDDGLNIMTVKICYPLKKYEEVPDFTFQAFFEWMKLYCK